MKATDIFKETIRQYVENNPTIDVNKHENKSIDECVDFILTQVQKSGFNGFTDDEIYGMAIHYYDEPNESLGKMNKHLSFKCVVNHTVELTEEEKQEMKNKTLEELKKQQINNLTKRNKPKTTEKKEEPQLSLF